jgi:large subunit ribosomal protein L19
MANQAQHGETVFNSGDLVRVHQKIKEANKFRVQVFEGIVISIRGRGENKTITVRKIGANKIGVERIWPLSSPWLEKVELVRQGKVRRAKLSYLRQGMNQLKFK